MPLAKVRAWLARRGWTLALTTTVGESYADYETRTVYVPVRVSAATRLAVALHECGHVLIGSRGHPRYGPGRTGIVAEEVDAWDRGRALGRRLGLRVDSGPALRAWNRARATCLLSYMRWASGA